MNLKQMIEEKRNKEIKETFVSFMNDTKSKEILIIILKSHLYLERQLILSLTETVIDEKVINGTTFKQKLDLAHSMGIITTDYGTMGKINSIRNSYAHNMDYNFDEKIFEDLLSTLNKEDKDDFLNYYDEMKTMFYDGVIPELNFKLQVLLSHVWFSMVGSRLMAKESVELRLNEKFVEAATGRSVNKD